MNLLASRSDLIYSIARAVAGFLFWRTASRSCSAAWEAWAGAASRPR